MGTTLKAAGAIGAVTRFDPHGQDDETNVDVRPYTRAVFDNGVASVHVEPVASIADDGTRLGAGIDMRVMTEPSDEAFGVSLRAGIRASLGDRVEPRIPVAAGLVFGDKKVSCSLELGTDIAPTRADKVGLLLGYNLRFAW